MDLWSVGYEFHHGFSSRISSYQEFGFDYVRISPQRIASRNREAFFSEHHRASNIKQGCYVGLRGMTFKIRVVKIQNERSGRARRVWVSLSISPKPMWLWSMAWSFSECENLLSPAKITNVLQSKTI